jgi:hypothetical protein
MDIHHDTSLSSILEDDSISSSSKAHICSCWAKGARVWLLARPSIYSFHITHFIFTLVLRFCLSLIQHLMSSFFTCECGHGLDASNTHLARCPFGGLRITAHDAIRNVMYALAWKVNTLYGESNGMPSCQEFHYELISTWLERTRSSLSMWWLLTQCGKWWLRMSLIDQ